MNSEDKNISELNSFIREVRDSFIEVPTGSRSLPTWATYSFKYINDKTGGEMYYELTIDPKKEYYISSSEIESLKNNRDLLLEVIKENEKIDFIEFGAGNASKAFIILEHLFKKTKDIEYYSIDLDAIGLKYLKEEFNTKCPNLKVECIEADFNVGLNFLTKKEVKTNKRKKLTALFGATIGNFNSVFRDHFLFKLKTSLNKGDLAIIGFDLVKDKEVMEKAYNDSNGVIKDCSKNLLHRLNVQCGGNFNLDDFDFKAIYIQESGRIGSVKSFLISKKRQEVSILGESIILEEGEKILAVDSYKFTEKDIDGLAKTAGFKIAQKLYDRNKWYVNVLFKA